jgi:hypothetical protein
MDQQFNEKSSPIPPRTLNGGLYTGEPFYKNAAYANFPVLPTSAYWTHYNLRSANPLPQALYQIQNAYRPGNNTDQAMPQLSHNSWLNATCIPSGCEESRQTAPSKCKVRVFST